MSDEQSHDVKQMSRADHVLVLAKLEYGVELSVMGKNARSNRQKKPHVLVPVQVCTFLPSKEAHKEGKEQEGKEQEGKEQRGTGLESFSPSC